MALVKVPPPPPRPEPSRPEDRNLVRRTVKGAAGGMLGVDYQEEPKADPKSAVRPGTETEATEKNAWERAAVALRAPVNVGGFADAALMHFEQEDPDLPTVRRRRAVVHRDRLTVDKDAPDLIRKKKRQDDSEDLPVLDDEPESLDLEALAEAITSAGDAALDRAERVHIGDPRLTQPEDIQRRLGSPMAYAKHVMILAESFRAHTGAERREAIEYLGRMFVSLNDRRFGRLALKEFGPATGIVDIYPLEVVAHVLDRWPAFLPKISRGKLFSSEGAKAEALSLWAGEPKVLSYDPTLKIRGFALMGGGTPGYRFEPTNDASDSYWLTVDSPGSYTLLISGVRAGQTIVEQLQVKVDLRPGQIAPPPRSLPQMPRDPVKVAAWPMPPEPVISPEPEEEVEARPTGGLNSKELWALREQDALRAQEEARGVVFEDAPDVAFNPLEAPLTFAEESMLRLALAAMVTPAELVSPSASEKEVVPKPAPPRAQTPVHPALKIAPLAIKNVPTPVPAPTPVQRSPSPPPVLTVRTPPPSVVALSAPMDDDDPFSEGTDPEVELPAVAPTPQVTFASEIEVIHVLAPMGGEGTDPEIEPDDPVELASKIDAPRIEASDLESTLQHSPGVVPSMGLDDDLELADPAPFAALLAEARPPPDATQRIGLEPLDPMSLVADLLDPPPARSVVEPLSIATDLEAEVFEDPDATTAEPG